MENKEEKEKSLMPSKEELITRQWERRFRELKISRTRAGVVKNQVLRAYEILENIRFTQGVSDTAFRGKITLAKRGLESAMGDFLLSDMYWERRVKEFGKRTPEEYDKYLKEMKSGKMSPVQKN